LFLFEDSIFGHELSNTASQRLQIKLIFADSKDFVFLLFLLNSTQKRLG
jgi:hypothetical protein